MKKTVLITGATSGLGKEAAFKIAEKGYNIILTGRDNAKGQKVLEELKVKSPNNIYQYYSIDFSSISAIKEGAELIKKEVNHIDVLLNNVGGVFSKFELTKDGFEKTIGVNHLGYFVFTLSILPILNKTSGRIVNVASDQHKYTSIDIDSFTKNKSYSILNAYRQSKLANVMFTYSLADKLSHTGITVNCLEPGKVKTDIGSKTKNILHSLVWKLNGAVRGISVEEGAKTHIFLAIHPDAATFNRKYFDCMVLTATSEASHNKKVQDDLWTWSEKVTNMKVDF